MGKKKKPKTWVEVFKAERKQFPKGHCATRVFEDKRHKKPKYKEKELDD